MCESSLSWQLVAQIWVLVLLALVVFDLLLRYLDSDSKGLLPWGIVGRIFFFYEDTPTVSSVDKRHHG